MCFRQFPILCRIVNVQRLRPALTLPEESRKTPCVSTQKIQGYKMSCKSFSKRPRAHDQNATFPPNAFLFKDLSLSVCFFENNTFSEDSPDLLSLRESFFESWGRAVKEACDNLVTSVDGLSDDTTLLGISIAEIGSCFPPLFVCGEVATELEHDE